MLIRNCETKLFQRSDFNVRVTIFDKNPKHYPPEAHKVAWIETIRDSLGGAIVNSTKEDAFTLTKEGQHYAYLYQGSGKGLIEKIKSKYQKPCSLRIELLGDTNRAWIIIVI